MPARLSTLIVVVLLGCAALAPDARAGNAHDHGGDLRHQVPVAHAVEGQPPLLRCGLADCWGDPWHHRHSSQAGTPFIHGFFTEPAFLGRDLFVDVSGADGETEVEAELEWALTRRLGLIAELPYADTEDASGIGDAALGLRALLVEESRFLLSVSAEVEFPTGDEDDDLGRGAFAFGASVHTWTDFGGWTTFQSQTGLEFVPDENEVAVTWAFTLAKSFAVSPLFGGGDGDGHGHSEHGPHTFSLLAEVSGEAAIAGDEKGEIEGLWLVGASYAIHESANLRAGFTRTFDGTNGWTVGIIIHL